MSSLKRKRRVYKNGCANPLFVKWVEEWRDDARERGVSSHYSYTKALNSLKKYPLPLKSGQEAKILDHVGEKLAKMLDRKLAEHHDNKESSPDTMSGSSPTNVDQTSASNAGPSSSVTGSSKAPPKKKRPSTRRRQSDSHEYVPVFRSGPYAILIALYKAEEKPSWRGYLTKSQLITEAQPHCDTSFTVADAGSYYTAWSSASSLVGRGLMIRKGHPPRFSLSDAGASMAIRLLQQTEGSRLSGSSQPGSSTSNDKSVSKTPAGRKRRKAGSPSRTVASQKKHCSDDSLVGEGVPSLKTATCFSGGAEKESIVLDLLSDDNDDDRGSPSGSDLTVVYSMEESDDDTETGNTGSTSCPTGITSCPTGITSCPVVFKELCFWYIDTDGREVRTKDEAAVTFNEKVSVGFLIMCDKALLKNSGLRYSIDHTRESKGPYTFAYLCNEDAPNLSNPPNKDRHSNSIPETPIPSTSRITSKTSSISTPVPRHTLPITPDGSAVEPITLTDSDSSEESSEPEVVPLAKRIKKAESLKTALTPSQAAGAAAIRRLSALENNRKHVETSSRLNFDNNGDNDRGSIITSKPPTSSRTRTVTGSKSAEVLHQEPSTSVGASACLSRPGLSCQTNQSVDLSSPQFVLRPGEFEVILCVDNSESTASRKSSTQFRGILLADLGKNGVPFDVRRLTVGDFTWIAREKATPVPGQLGLPTSREVVLEHIVERKRMDDLAGSIMDGRFAEQKFRLHSCGVRYSIYLVEEYGDSSHLKMPLRSLIQAIANTQVIDGFHIKTTADIRESVAYLTVMTRALQKHYAGKTIKAYSPETVSDLNEKNRMRQGMERDTVYSIPFRPFNEASIKNKVLTVHEMFGRHLFQLPGFSAERAAAVLKLYPTPSHLLEAYRQCATERERENMLSDVRSGQAKRRLGCPSSRLVYGLYWSGKAE